MEGRRWRTFKIERGSDRMRSTILRAVLDLGGEQQGTELLSCRACVREWISREGEQHE